MDKLKKVLSGQDTEDRSGLSEVVESSSLSWSTRIKGFIVCFALGILCSLLGTLLLWVSRKGLFAVFYTLGNITSIGRYSLSYIPYARDAVKKCFAVCLT
ncbi:similar to RIKEN cDNA 2010005O13, isoform CRA_b [Rattus norvegicus]|uniref:Vesicle transport protein n=1 Tax=Rattus norvegicus TaxID=10116 RepID=A6IDG3_RAT|nr:similar to RIKEN cDNA 2010005O13, isoform CRA_b [Rattus norvegicus]